MSPRSNIAVVLVVGLLNLPGAIAAYGDGGQSPLDQCSTESDELVDALVAQDLSQVDDAALAMGDCLSAVVEARVCLFGDTYERGDVGYVAGEIVRTPKEKDPGLVVRAAPAGGVYQWLLALRVGILDTCSSGSHAYSWYVGDSFDGVEFSDWYNQPRPE